jgi:hypothetical protein
MFLTLSLALACATTPDAAEPMEPAPAAAPAPAPAAKPAPTETPAPAAAPLQPGDKDAGFSARCADGQVVVPFWQGEYPSPIVQVGAGVTAKVALDPCGKATRDCTLAPGLYHPWASESDSPRPAAGFATRTRTQTQKAKQAFRFGGVSFAAGDELEVLTYLSEGMCSMRAKGVMFEEMCPGTTEGDDARWTEPTEPGTRTQLLEVRCTGETRPFWLTVDDAFMGTQGVREGEMRGFGEVAPAAP